MEKNGKNHIGIFFTIALLLVSLLILTRIVTLSFGEADESIIYLDPTMSTTLVRGTIYDRNKNIIAIEAPKYGFLVKSSSDSPAYIASLISSYISISSVEAEEIIRKGTGFIELNDIPSLSEINTIEKLLKVLELEEYITLTSIEERRYNAEGSFKAFIGSVDSTTMSGVSGFERYANSLLTPKPGLGYYVIYGSSITTTIDLKLQNIVEEVVAENGGASTVAILSSSGEIYAYYGIGNDEIYKSIILSVSSNGSSITYSHSFPNDVIKENAIKADSDGTFYFYIDGAKDKEAILNSLHKVLINSGKIKEQN